MNTNTAVYLVPFSCVQFIIRNYLNITTNGQQQVEWEQAETYSGIGYHFYAVTEGSHEV
jgi:hypothetical protein